MKNNLVPTQIVNKNGVRTTVYKRDATALPKSSSLPAPDLRSTSSRTEKLSSIERTKMTDEITMSFVRNMYTTSDIDLIIDRNNPLAMEFRETLATYNDETIAKLHTNVQTEPRSNKAIVLASQKASEERMMNYLVIYENDQKYERLFKSGRGHSFSIFDAVNSLSTYPQLQYENTEHYYQQITALTGVVTAIQSEVPNESHWDDHSNGRLITYTPNPEYGRQQDARLTSDDLIDLILEQPDRWEQIADIAASRRTDDVDLIRSVLNSDTSAVSGGML